MNAQRLVELWSSYPHAGIHPADAKYRSRLERHFETRLSAVPWAGSILSAKAFVLFLNPGLDDRDLEEEKKEPFKSALRRNLKGNEPYLYLQNAHASHSGYKWASETFGGLPTGFHDKICILQLVPYHSRKGAVARRIAPMLPTSQMAQAFGRHLLKRAKAGEIALVVARSCRQWGITAEEQRCNRVVVYSSSEVRRAYQTENSRGGKLLLAFLGENP